MDKKKSNTGKDRMQAINNIMQPVHGISPTFMEKPITDRMSRYLKGQQLDEPITDPANPNLFYTKES